MIKNSNSHYSFSTYVSKRRWASYWNQIDEVIQLHIDNLLLIGKGDGIVGDVLKKEGIEVISFDIEPKVKPDFLGNVINIKSIFEDRTFDGILCRSGLSPE